MALGLDKGRVATTTLQPGAAALKAAPTSEVSGSCGQPLPYAHLWGRSFDLSLGAWVLWLLSVRVVAPGLSLCPLASVGSLCGLGKCISAQSGQGLSLPFPGQSSKGGSPGLGRQDGSQLCSSLARNCPSPFLEDSQKISSVWVLESDGPLHPPLCLV